MIYARGGDLSGAQGERNAPADLRPPFEITMHTHTHETETINGGAQSFAGHGLPNKAESKRICECSKYRVKPKMMISLFVCCVP